MRGPEVKIYSASLTDKYFISPNPRNGEFKKKKSQSFFFSSFLRIIITEAELTECYTEQALSS